jgi:effector-binding domain-containing protein
MTEEITLVDVPAQKVLGMTRTGDYHRIPELITTIYDHIASHQVTITGPPVFICHETSPEEVKAAMEQQNARVEVAWPVSGQVAETEEIRSYDLPGGRMVHAVHKGPYETCEPTYLRVFAWIAEKGLSISGPVREVYTNDPGMVQPGELITEIYIPVMG